MRFSFSAFVFHVVVVGTTTFPESIGSTTIRKMAKNQQHATAPPTPTPPPVRYLVAQPGTECSIRAQQALSFNYIVSTSDERFSGDATTPTESDDDKRSYTLRATVSTATIAFAERPARTAITVKTEDFVKEFDDALFVTSKPNGAITFFSEEDGVSSVTSSSVLDLLLLQRKNDVAFTIDDTEPSSSSSSSPSSAAVDSGPLIVVLSQPKIVGPNPDDRTNSTLVVEYTLRQSESQRAVVSIETFMNRTFRSCSIFIDSADSAEIDELEEEYT